MQECTSKHVTDGVFFWLDQPAQRDLMSAEFRQKKPIQIDKSSGRDSGGKVGTMQRPTGVTIIAVLAFIGAGLCVLAALGALVGAAFLSNMTSYPGMGALAGVGAVMVGVLLIGLAVLDVFIGIGLLKLQNWARILTIVFAALGLLGVLIGLPFARLHVFFFIFVLREIIFAAVEIWILVYLLQPHVKQAFGAKTALA